MQCSPGLLFGKADMTRVAGRDYYMFRGRGVGTLCDLWEETLRQHHGELSAVKSAGPTHRERMVVFKILDFCYMYCNICVSTQNFSA